MLRRDSGREASHPGSWRRWALVLMACAAAAGAGPFGFAGSARKPADVKSEPADKARTDRYGDALPAGALARLGSVRMRHGAAVTHVAFLPDGKALLTASQDGTIRLWDAATGKEVRRFGQEQPDDTNPARPGAWGQVVFVGLGGLPAGASAIALSADGKTLAAARPNNAIHLWETATGKELRTVPGPAGGVGTLAFSPDGKTLAGRGSQPAVYLWETATGKEVRQLKSEPKQQGGVVFMMGNGFGAALAYSPDGQALAVAETEFANQKIVTTIKLWDPATGKEVRRVPAGEQQGLSCLAYSPDGKMLAYGIANALHLCDPATGKEIRQVQGQEGMPLALAFAPDSKTLAVKSMNNAAVRLCDVGTGKVVRRLGDKEVGAGNLPFVFGFGGAGRDLAFSPDGKRVAVGGGNTVCLWDAADGKEVSPIDGHTGAVGPLTVAPGGLVVTRGDHTIRVWELASGKERHRFRVPAQTTCAALAPDGGSVALGASDSTLRLHEVATGKELRRFKGHQNGIAVVAFSPDGKTLASRGSTDNTIRLCETATGKELRAIPIDPNFKPGQGQGFVVWAGVTGPGMGLVFSPDGKMLASPGLAQPNGGMMPGGMPVSSGTLNLWDVATGKEVRQITLPAQPGVVCFAFSPDGRTLATENSDRTVTLWEVAGGKERGRLGRAAPPAVAQPGGGMMVVGGFGGGFSGFGSADSLTLAYAPDGRTLAARGPDRSVQVWDVLAAKQVCQRKGHGGSVTSIAFTPDGKALVSGSSDTTALVWDLAGAGRGLGHPPAVQTAGEVERLWDDLAGEDAARAFQAIIKMAGAPGLAVPLLRERLRPAVPADPKKLAQWIADLDSEKFQVREEATEQLEKLGELAVPALNRALAGQPSLEARKRIERLVEKLTGQTLTREQLRLVRALEVLEWVGSREARRVLQALAAGAPGALATREAQAALDRLARQTAARP